MPSFADRIRHAWNAFLNRSDPAESYQANFGPSYSYRPDRLRLLTGNERSIISSVYTRIGIDVSSIALRHVRLDQNGRFLEIIPSGLNRCLTLEANIDQSGRAFIQDVVMSLMDEGSVAIVPVDTTFNPAISGSFDVQSMRTGKILEWFPGHVRVSVYNEKRGLQEELILPKTVVVIIENPLYSVMNEPNSTLKRLITKLNLLDAIDIQSGSGKLDLLIQLPYVVRTAARREQAALRRADIETQLSGSKYGIAYIDATEKVTQLNRPAENNLMDQIEYLTSMLYGQLGITEDVINGTADEKTMLVYHNRTIEPILYSIIDGLTRRFITKTAQTQGQAIKYFRNPFGLVSAEVLATIADAFTRNEILSSNEVRDVLGFKPSDDPKADELRNKNLNPVDSSKIEKPLEGDNVNGQKQS